MERIIFTGGKKKGKNGGARKGAGRPLGARNKFSQHAVAAARETGKLPHEIMLEVAQAAVGAKITGWGVVDKEDKKWALYSCANYFAPKMTATEHSGQVYIMSLPSEALDGLDVIELEVIEKVFGKLAARSNGHAPTTLLEAPVYDPDE